MVAPIIWGYGGDLLTPDHKRCIMDQPPAVVAAIKFLADLRNTDHAAPTVSENSNAAYPFEGGRIGMTFDFMGVAFRYRTIIIGLSNGTLFQFCEVQSAPPRSLRAINWSWQHARNTRRPPGALCAS